MDKVRFGVIGIGNMGTDHCKSLFNGLVKDAALTAICDVKPARLEYAKENFPGVNLYGNATDMFKSGDIDAVLIAVPHYDHPTLAMEAFDYKLHVLIEKPAGVFTKKVREMNEKSKGLGLTFGIMYNQRTNSMYKKMREMVQSGELGEIKRTNWIITNWFRTQFYYDSGEWRATWAGEGGGVLLNQCPHNLDLWQWICGMPEKVTAFCHEGKWHNIEVEDDVTAYVEYSNGATGVFITTTADAPGTNRFEITGNNGKLVYENDRLTFYKLKIPEKELTFGSKVSFVHPEADVINIETDGSNPQHKGVLAAFVGNVLRGEPLIAEGCEGINGLMISNAMHLSSWLGRTVTLPIDEELFLAELNKKIENSKIKKQDSSSVANNMSESF